MRIKVRAILVIGWTAALVFLVFTINIWAGSATKLSAIDDLAPLKKFYHLKNFQIGGRYDLANKGSFENGGEGGVTLESLGQKPLRLAYIALGTPRRDSLGRIENAIVINPFYAGDAALTMFFWGAGQGGNNIAHGPVIGPGLLIDTDKYYVILLDSLGMWGAGKPSDGLGASFPQYNLFDMVQANYRLIRDELNVSGIKLVAGVSIGGMQTYLWALMHPEMVEAIMPLGGAIKENSNIKWLLSLMNAAMQSDPAWRETNGDYYDRPKDGHPNQGLMFGWSILERTGYSPAYRSTQPWSEIKKKVFSWTPAKGMSGDLKGLAGIYDVNDLILRNRSLDGFDISSEIGRIKARTLIIHVKNDQWLPWAEAEEAAQAIPGARLLGFDSLQSHFGIAEATSRFKDEIESFLKEPATN